MSNSEAQPEPTFGPDGGVMRTTDAKDTTVPLVVGAQDLPTEIYVIDSSFRLVARGWGELTVDLPPGIYSVKARAAYATEEQLVVLRPGRPHRHTIGPLAFATAIPLTNTHTQHTPDAAAARSQSLHEHVKAGTGSWIFVMARKWPSSHQDAGRLQSPQPHFGLKLRTQSGVLVADLAETALVDSEAESSAVCNLRIDPGIYRLGVDFESGHRVEQTVVACAGWQTQVFCFQRDYDRRGEVKPATRCEATDGLELERRGWRADLPGASILMGKGCGFDPADPQLRLVDLIRHGLSIGQRVLPDDQLRRLLAEPDLNPMFGIYAAQLVRQWNDFNSLVSVVARLRDLLGHYHPDVEALALKLEPKAESRAGYIFEAPPMLRASWHDIVDASATRPELVPPDSLSARASLRSFGDGPWMTWTSPSTEGAGVGESLNPSETSAWEALLEQYLEREADDNSRADRRSSAAPLPESSSAPPIAPPTPFARPSVGAAARFSELLKRTAPRLTAERLGHLARRMGVARGTLERLLRRANPAASQMMPVAVDAGINTEDELYNAPAQELAKWVERVIFHEDWAPLKVKFAPLKTPFRLERMPRRRAGSGDFRKALGQAAREVVLSMPALSLLSRWPSAGALPTKIPLAIYASTARAPQWAPPEWLIFRSIVLLAASFNVRELIPRFLQLFERQKAQQADAELLVYAIARMVTPETLGWLEQRLDESRYSAAAYQGLTEADARAYRDSKFLPAAKAASKDATMPRAAAIVAQTLVRSAPESNSLRWMADRLGELLHSGDATAVLESLLRHLRHPTGNPRGMFVRSDLLYIPGNSVHLLRVLQQGRRPPLTEIGDVPLTVPAESWSVISQVVERLEPTIVKSALQRNEDLTILDILPTV